MFVLRLDAANLRTLRPLTGFRTSCLEVPPVERDGEPVIDSEPYRSRPHRRRKHKQQRVSFVATPWPRSPP